MYNKIVLSLVITLYLLFTLSAANAQDVCVKKTACSCEFSNGTGVDLSPSAKSSFLTAQIFQAKENGKQYELSTYYYHPCFDVLPKVNASLINNTCGKPLSICRHINTMSQINTTATYSLDNGQYDFMGSSNVTSFGADGKSIVYFNGPSSTVVLLFCAEAEDSLHVYSLAEPDKIVLSFYSRSACLQQIEELFLGFLAVVAVRPGVIHDESPQLEEKFDQQGPIGESAHQHHIQHEHAKSHQSIKFEHFHPVPVYVKKEFSHLLKHPLEKGKSEQELKQIHPEHQPHYGGGLVLEDHRFDTAQFAAEHGLGGHGFEAHHGGFEGQHQHGGFEGGAEQLSGGFDSKKYKDLCESAYWTSKCMYEFDPKNFFFP